MSPRRETPIEQANHLLRIEIMFFPRHMFGESKGLHFFLDGSLHNAFQAVFAMTAELARVTMMREGHFPQKILAKSIVVTNGFLKIK